ncbi:MAG: signal peptidase II [Solirubrobacteraceae bacterium]
MMPRRATGLALGLLAIVLFADQLTKRLVRGSLLPNEEHSVLPGLKLVRAMNHGIAFSVAAGGQNAVIALVAIAVLAIGFYFRRNATRPLAWLPTGLLLGGALGNLVDRLNDGAVTDFIKLPLWPAFNVADVAITFGVASLLLVLERRGA